MLRSVPHAPGVYQFKDARGKPLYIGKAVDLHDRVRQYCAQTDSRVQMVRRLMRKADAVTFIVTASEYDALVLEANLIKQHRPHYNVLLKDDKHYPFLKLTHEPFPMLVVTRRVLKDGGHYYGPYPDAGAVRRVKNLVDTMFPLRKNSGLPMQRKPRPCLNYHMGRCLAPCIGEADPQEYARVVQDVKNLLEGRSG